MVATPTYASAPIQSGQRVQFHTTTAALEIVRAQNPALYQRLLAYRSGQDVKVTAKERAYLQRVNRVAAAAQTRATEFSSQSRIVSREASQSYAQAPAKKTEVIVTPDPWKWWTDLFAAIAKGSGALSPFFPIAAFVSAVAIVINLFILAIKAFADAIAAAGALTLPK